MQTIATDNTKTIAAKKSNLGELTFKYFLNPVKAGIAGFSTFFMLLLFTKFVGYVVGISTIFNVSMNDVLLSLIGFSLIFSIKILENFKG